MTINWLHLSDFHIGKERYAQQNICKEIIEHVQERVQSEKKPLDFIFITGDLANKGQADEFDTFHNEFLNKLIEVSNLDFERIIIVPGNHDVDINVGNAVERYGIYNRLKNFFDPTEDALKNRKYLFERFAEYVKQDKFSPKFKEKHWLESPLGCSIRKFDDINGYTVGILGLNTAWLSEGDKPDRGNLTPGVEITANGLETIKDREVRIVLGHHPFNWWVNEHLSPEDCKEIKSLFAQNKVIYLHGHLHVKEEIYEYGSAHQFISIGAGACFAAKKDEIWKNGLLWGSLDMESEEVFIEPLVFIRKERKKWIFDSFAFSSDFLKSERGGFIFPIPQEIIKTIKVSKYTPLPLGWRKIDKHFLHEKRGGFRSSELADFFEGAFPTWSNLLSGEIPIRPATQKLVDDISKAGMQKDEICLRVLLGAGGEGKTTVLMQTVIDLISSNNNWNILWHESVNKDLDELNWPHQYIESLPAGEGNWLIVSDAAATIANGLWDTLKILKEDGREDIHFLISCRTSDWYTVDANQILWDRCIENYEEIILNLRPEEAEGILKAWKKHGGLKELSKITFEEAVEKFRQVSISEAGHFNGKEYDEGTLLGAMLTLRYGRRLRSHVFDLLQKLNKKNITPECTLLDAYAFIAFPHANDVRILSKTVLAKTLGVKKGDLNSMVLSKLADEAAIFTPSFAGKFQEKILTRHKSIANTVAEIMDKEFKYDFLEKIYVPLIQNALKLFSEGKVIVPYLNEWNHLPRHFFLQGKIDFAIQLTEAKQEVSPENPFYITEMANLFRDESMFLEAVQQFRDAPERIHRDRAYYVEWGICEGMLKNHEINIWLTGISVADVLEKRIFNYEIGDLDNLRVGVRLNGLSKAFKALYSLDEKNSVEYLEAYGACTYLCLKSQDLDDETRRSLDSNLSFYKSKTNTSIPIDDSNALSLIERCIRLAGKNADTSELPRWLKPTDELKFKGLEWYFGLRK